MDESNLADMVIRANKEEKRADNGPDYDDIGLRLPPEGDEHAWCEYLTARIWYLNPYMYLHEGRLWVNEVELVEDKATYYRLAMYPKPIREHECQYVWARLHGLVPVLDPDVIAVLPDVTFNMRTGELKHEKVWTTTPWKEK